MKIKLNENFFEIYNENELIFKFSLYTAVEPFEKKDVDDEILNYEKISENEFEWTTRSNIWEKKVYKITVKDDGILYNVSVFGKGKIDKVKYFAKESSYDASKYFIPSVPGDGVDNRIFTTAQSGTIAMGYLTPPPFCFPFYMEGQNSWIGAGLICEKGKYNFDSFSYVSNNSSCEFNVNLYEYTEVDGMYELPGILFVKGIEEYEVLQNYTNFHFNNGYCNKTEILNEKWWYGPLFCGWGQQMRDNSQNPYAIATQEYYTNLSERLCERELYPSAIIIDDKWQEKYGTAIPDKEKFPDLRRFVDEQHKNGKKVILWFKSWSSEGLDADECVSLLCQPYGADPTNPKYIERIKNVIHHLISSDEGCCDCDGFKIDFANCMPLGRNLEIYEKGVYGIELLKRWITLIYNCTKAEKKEALINNSCCHPYFYEVTDQVRLHDYCGDCRNSEYALGLRSNIFKSAMPGKLIDTDGANDNSRRDAMRYIRKAAKIGVPDLYIIDSKVLVEEDWEEIKNIWLEYKNNL